MTNLHVEGNGGGLKHRSWTPHGNMGNSYPSARGGPSLETHFLDFRKWTSDCLFLWICQETVSTQATVPQGPEGLLRGSDLAQQVVFGVLGGRKGSM